MKNKRVKQMICDVLGNRPASIRNFYRFSFYRDPMLDRSPLCVILPSCGSVAVIIGTASLTTNQLKGK